MRHKPSRTTPSDLVGGRYRLDRASRPSDAGTVHTALDTATGRTVAVEVATLLEDPSARARFKRDALMAQRLEGDHVLQVLDIGQRDDGTPWIAREPVLSSIASEISRRGRIGTQQAAAWALEACEAVAEGHAIGLAHGDIRPDTIHLARGAGGAPIVKVQWPTGAKATRRVRESAEADIRGIAHLVRALCTGRLASHGVDDAPTLPTEVVQVMARAESADPKQRFANLAELARALGPFAPQGHDGLRNVEFLLCRAGIVTQRFDAIATRPSAAPLFAGAVPSPERDSEPPASVRRVRRDRVGDEWFLDDGPEEHEPADGTPQRSSRAARFATVCFLVVGAVIAGTMAMSTSRHVPSWAAAAAPDAPILTDIAAEPMVASGQPETIAWADQLTESAVEDLGRVPAHLDAKAEREKGVIEADATGEAATNAMPGGSEAPSLAAPVAPAARPQGRPTEDDGNPAVPASTAPIAEPTSPLPSTTPPELPPQPNDTGR